MRKMIYTENFVVEIDPAANAQSVISGPDVRFSVLTPRLLRLEFCPGGEFEDRPSQAFWYRRQAPPPFEARESDGRIEIETDFLLLRYEINDAGFTPQTLSVTLKESGTTWQYGQADALNLLGTARTLDNVDGALVLDQGLLSRQGWAVYDDSGSLVFDDRGWLAARESGDEALDLYFFGFGRDFQGCLGDFAAVSGAAALLPRWALGNWWSRYWAYSDEELLGLMDDFRAHDVPLSTCIVDMDWHITETGNACSGWTGYTWNRELFPDPPAFIQELHKRGLKTALNLHPAEGIHAHEAQYAAMAERLGLDAENEAPIAFDIADPAFTSAYFELLHHPYEVDGVDFWWMDWQQGTVSGLAGLDPLWWLNHLHFHDLERDGQKRPFVFSRWGGLGNHRYPIGFSGDALVTWDSLAFQPYFTATAANVNYGWWSHDIGGHMGGIEDAELFARWVQFGVFSPIFRVHCTNNPFHERRPWGYDEQTEAVTSAAMRLRHELIPYLYSMAWRNHLEHAPLVRPMYHAYAAEEAAYHCPDQYLFGSELIAAPFIAPAGESTRLSRQTAWLPEGDWYDFFRAERYPGDGWQAIYGGLRDIPVFARAGAIVPLAKRSGWSDTDNPEAFTVHLFPGADNEFILYEDDGRRNPIPCRMPIHQTWTPESWQVTVGATQGESDFLPDERSFDLHLRGIGAGAPVTATLDNDVVEITTAHDEETAALIVSVPAKEAGQTLIVTVGGPLQLPEVTRLPACRRMVQAFKMESWEKQRLNRELGAIVADPALLASYELSLTGDQIRALVEVMTGSGFHRGSVRRAKEEAIVLWNNAGSDAVSYKLVARDLNLRPEREKGVLPRFAVLHTGDEVVRMQRGSQTAVGLLSVGDWFDSLVERLGSGQAGGVMGIVQFDILGAQGRSGFLTLAEDGSAALADGKHEAPDVTITAESSDWLALINGQISPEEAFMSGKLQVMGKLELVLQLADTIRFSPPSTYAPGHWRLELNYLDMLTAAVDGQRQAAG